MANGRFHYLTYRISPLHPFLYPDDDDSDIDTDVIPLSTVDKQMIDTNRDRGHLKHYSTDAARQHWLSLDK